MIDRMLNDVESAFCCRCGTVKDCRVFRTFDSTRWECKSCGSVCDEEYDNVDEFHEEYDSKEPHHD